jgi:hypothetical protein
MQNLPPGSSSTPGQAPGVLSALDPLRVVRIIQADPDALMKCGLTLLISLVPVLGTFVVLGWLTYALRRAHANVTPVLLPPPSELSTALDYAEQGFKAFAVSLCWTLPSIVFTLSFVGCIWFGIAGSVVAGASQGEELGALMMVVGILAMFVGMLLLAVINVLLSIPAAIATLRAELSGVFAEGFAVSAVLGMARANFVPWVLNLLMLVLVQMGVTFLAVVPVVGIFLANYVAMLVRGFAMLSVYEYILFSTGTEAFPVGPLAPQGMRG